jgi:carbonic anhydrase
MDGRIQLPVIEYLQDRFGVDYIDNITAAGPVGVIATSPDSGDARSMIRLIDISISVHGSGELAIVAHHDCAGNPISDDEQKQQLKLCLEMLSERFPEMEIITLWLDDTFQIQEYPE